MAPTLDVEKGLKELREKQMLQIERETAKTWGGRACASFRLAVEAEKLGERVRHLYEGENYRQEALEHASMTEDFDFLHEVVTEIDEYRKDALENIQTLLTKAEKDLSVPAKPQGERASRGVRIQTKTKPAAAETVTKGPTSGRAEARAAKFREGAGRRQ